MIGPLVYLVTSCDYTISNNDLALDMKSAVSIPFCGGIKNHVHYHLSILQEILLTYLFMRILDLSDFFLKNHMAWGYIKTHISWNVQNICTILLLYNVEISPVTKMVYKARGLALIYILYFNKNIRKPTFNDTLQNFPFYHRVYLSRE